MLKKNKFLQRWRTKKQGGVYQLQETADFIDYILLNLEAGANIEQAYIQAVANLEPGTFKDQASRVLTMCAVGFSFWESMRFLLKEKNMCFVLQELLESLSLSLKLGSPLIKVLTHLSHHFRLLAATTIEELANEAPIKMIFPLVLFIFPVIFILLGAGAIENLIHSFNL